MHTIIGIILRTEICKANNIFRLSTVSFQLVIYRMYIESYLMGYIEILTTVQIEIVFLKFFNFNVRFDHLSLYYDSLMSYLQLMYFSTSAFISFQLYIWWNSNITFTTIYIYVIATFIAHWLLRHSTRDLNFHLHLDIEKHSLPQPFPF